MKSRQLQAAGLRWRCLEAGEGPPLVLLHGFPEDARSFDRVLPALPGLRLIAPDLKGYGETDKPRPGGPNGDYRPSRMADELAALLDVLAAEAGVQQLDVVGHDWGGILLSALVARHPRLVRRAVLLNAPVVRFVPWRPVHVYAFNLPWLPEAAFARDPRAFVRGILRWWTAVDEAFTEEDVARYAEALSGGSIRCALAYYRGLPRDLPFIVDAWRSLRTRPAPPTLIIWGARDPILPLAVGRMGAEDLRARLAVIPAAGHFVHREAPAEVARLILEHLEVSPSRRGTRP
ncbi:MAG: alpha/beta hydrolase [Myxococcales bacterium]